MKCYMKKGYTLIEIIVVIVMLSIIASFFIPVIKKARQNARELAVAEANDLPIVPERLEEIWNGRIRYQYISIFRDTRTGREYSISPEGFICELNLEPLTPIPLEEQ